MVITKLHVLLALIVVTLGGIFYLHQTRETELAQAEKTQPAPTLVKPPEVPAVPLPKPATGGAVEPKVFEPAATPTLSPIERRYTIRRGDTLWSIALKKEHFGVGHRWYDIWKKNEPTIPDFDQLPVGAEIVIPLDVPDGFHWPETSAERKRYLQEQPCPPVQRRKASRA